MKPSHVKPPVFLDRDGTLIVEKHYLSDPDQVVLEHKVVEGLRMLQDAQHSLVVVSNQSGIGQGKYTAADAVRVNARVEDLLRRHGVEILAWYLCPHAPDAACSCRKPSPGMALAAASDWGLQLAGSYVIGDKKSDLELADAIGGMGILVATGHGRQDLAWATSQSRPAFDDLGQAAAYVCTRESGSATLGVGDERNREPCP